VPVGQSGIAFLGDHQQFVTLGRQRIASVADNGVVDVTVSFAPGEKTRTLFGFAPMAVAVTSLAGAHRAPVWDPASELFTVVVTPDASGTAHLRLFAKPISLQTTGHIYPEAGSAEIPY